MSIDPVGNKGREGSEPLSLHDYLGRLLAYNDWANKEALASVRVLDHPPPRALRFLAHIVGAERLWLRRLEQSAEPAMVWPELTLDQCEEGLLELGGRWRGFLAGLTSEGLSGVGSYVNSKGEPWSSRIDDILMHVVLHSSYHRGQLASEVRSAGHPPANTDFIHYVRQGLLP